ncbi:CheR family methyltransferase [Methylocucumis oryzae]|uniref:CheR family methyltransferase n=1 Tax=Methylocucumis oryzae TaxID=1632867 RepID=UPI00195535B0
MLYFCATFLIYFDTVTKRRVVGQILTKLKPDGVLFVGSAESLGGVIPGLVNIGPGVYRQDRRK